MKISKKIMKEMLVETILDCADKTDDILDGSIYADELRELADKIEKINL